MDGQVETNRVLKPIRGDRIINCGKIIHIGIGFGGKKPNPFLSPT